jgi:hypothetical protein
MRRPAFSGLIVLVLMLLPLAASAQPALPIFDAHLHYNWEPRPYYSLERVLETFRSHGISGILANSRPNDGTRALVEARPAGLRVVAFLRPYRVRGDIQTWFQDPATLDLIAGEFERGYYVGIGEFHLHGQDARSDVVRRLVGFARDRGLWLHAHSDVAALEILFAEHSQARIVWAHTGFSLPAAEVAAMLERHPGLVAELSYRSGITGPMGQLTEEWRQLFLRFPDRFLLGSDTWIDERWDSYGSTMAGYRAWLATLPREVAAKIAHGNGERLFGAARP